MGYFIFYNNGTSLSFIHIENAESKSDVLDDFIKKGFLEEDIYFICEDELVFPFIQSILDNYRDNNPEEHTETINKNPTKQIGLITNTKIGLFGDNKEPMLYFQIFVSENEAADQFINWDAAKDFIQSYGISDLKELDGKPIWVKIENDIVHIAGPCVIMKT